MAPAWPQHQTMETETDRHPVAVGRLVVEPESYQKAPIKSCMIDFNGPDFVGPSNSLHFMATESHGAQIDSLLFEVFLCIRITPLR